MKTCVVLLVLLVVLGSCISASAEELPAKGTKQLMFSFGGGHLSNYKGGIGVRYYLREKTALRFGLDVNWTTDDDAGWDHNVSYGETRQTIYTYDSSGFSVGLGTMLERHFSPSRKIVPFAGVGVFYWYDKFKSDRIARTEDTLGWNSMGTTTREYKGHTVEGILLAGLQWHFASNMSLGGEYRIKLKYSYREYEDGSLRDGDSSEDYDARKVYDLTLDSSELWLAISFYLAGVVATKRRRLS